MTATFRPIIGLAMERCIPYADDVLWSLIQLAQQGYPFIQTVTAPVDVVCNKFAAHLLATDFTHLVILGIDHVHPADLMRRFEQRVTEDPARQVIVGLSFRRGAPFDPLAFVYKDDNVYTIASWEPGELVRVDAAGTNEMCIAREVFERIPAPWFYRDYSVKSDGLGGLSEDLVFCRSLREHGIALWLDTSITNEHLFTGRIGEQTFRTYLATHREAIEEATDGGN